MTRADVTRGVDPTRPAGEGRLFVVATPIGNLEDITLRALRVLREVDRVLAEDTRRTRALLSHHGIGAPLRAFHAHSSELRVEAICAELEAGARLALVTDAGTPIVSDPGANLVAMARARGLAVEVIPGPSAPLVALVGSGFLANRFRFVGFLPRSGRRRRELIASFARDEDALILFEAPTRLAATLRDLEAALGERPIAVCRELTKLHEEFVRGSARELAERFEETRGEITIVVAPTLIEKEEPPDEATLRERALALLEEGQGAKEAADALAELAGIPRREAYRIVLSARAL